MSRKTLDPHMWNLESLLEAVYNVPVYQRPYSWDREQIEVLLSDIFETYESEEKNEGYYTGNIIVYDKNDKINGLITCYDIIDGQQRITSFCLMLLALYSLALIRKNAETDSTIMEMKRVLWKFVNREYKKEYKAVTLNSIEKKCFSNIYDHCFDKPEDIREYCEKYLCDSRFEERVIHNFILIYDTLDKKLPKEPAEGVLDFADYILRFIYFIVIEANCKENKVFSMFESINSKGKRLEEIDLIKTYIFSRLDENSYSTYLERWGDLIIKTKDNLYDYLYNYIKAYLCFYRQNITIANFKAICKRELLTHFNETNEAEALKKLLDDMYHKVEFYQMLSSVDKAYELVKSTKFRFFYKVFTEISYKHPKALFLRTLIELKEGKMTREDAVDIVTETISFMIKFLSISGRASRDAVTLFSGIMNEVYSKGSVQKETVINAIAGELLKQGITAEGLKGHLKAMDAYEQNKKLAIALLALYESASKENEKIKISYDQAYMLLDSFSRTLSLDHLLVQTPDKDSDQYQYYKDEETGTLVLKSQHDFPENLVVNGMDYETFTHSILNKIGNLRIYYRDKNSRRQNTSISLKEYPNFCTYKDIEDRGSDLVHVLIDQCLPAPVVDLTKIQTNSRKKAEAALPKMDKLIEFGLVVPGDKLYITVSPENSEAVLMDDKYVDYQGEKLTLNEWGCKVTGWKSIRIYAYAAIIGEIETLQEKRLHYVQEHNEAAS